jgi:hypothetical protein
MKKEGRRCADLLGLVQQFRLTLGALGRVFSPDAAILGEETIQLLAYNWVMK